MSKKLNILMLLLLMFSCHVFADEITNNDKLMATVSMMSVEELEKYFKTDSNVEVVDKYGFTILSDVALLREPEILKKWIEAGADVNAESFFGSTPLFFAVAGNRIDNIKLLVDAGANVNKTKNDGDSVLHFALRKIYTVWDGTIVWLINHGADVNALDSDGKSPLHILRERKKYGWGESEKYIEEVLLSKGAKDISGF